MSRINTTVIITKSSLFNDYELIIEPNQNSYIKSSYQVSL